MAEQEAPVEGTEEKPSEAEVEKQAFLDRLNKQSEKTKAEAERATNLEKQLAELKAQMEEREQANLPELERERKRAERLEKEAQDATKRAEEVELRSQRMQAQQWVLQAAAKLNFIDAEDAVVNVKLDEVTDATSAERAVKNLAKQKSHLVKQEDPKLPGRVLKNGRQEDPDDRRRSATGVEADAEAVGQAWQEFVNRTGWTAADAD